MAILYTQAQVNTAQLRAQVAMYEISQSIENGFYYLYSPVYQTYKDLQYDIYTLFNVISNETSFVTYSSNPTTYESQFYELVGSLINKTKQFDVYGQFGGTTNPNYQPPAGTIINVTTTGATVQIFNRTQADLIADGFGGYYLPFIDNSGNPFSGAIKPLEITVDGVGISLQPNYDFFPMRLYGFSNNAPQVIILTVI